MHRITTATSTSLTAARTAAAVVFNATPALSSSPHIIQGITLRDNPQQSLGSSCSRCTNRDSCKCMSCSRGSILYPRSTTASPMKMTINISRGTSFIVYTFIFIVVVVTGLMMMMMMMFVKKYISIFIHSFIRLSVTDTTQYTFDMHTHVQIIGMFLTTDV